MQKYTSNLGSNNLLIEFENVFMLYFPKENKAFSFTRRFFLVLLCFKMMSKGFLGFDYNDTNSVIFIINFSIKKDQGTDIFFYLL